MTDWFAFILSMLEHSIQIVVNTCQYKELS